MRGLSLVVASGGHSSSRCAGLSLSRPLLLRSRGSRRAGPVTVAHRPSCSVACGIFPDQGSNPCPLHWQADSQPLRHQGSPHPFVLWLLQLLDCCLRLCVHQHQVLTEGKRREWGTRFLFQDQAVCITSSHVALTNTWSRLEVAD